MAARAAPVEGAPATLTPKPVSLHPAALAEAEAAVDWYRERSEKAAEGFLRELDRAIGQIAQNPDRFPVFESGTRRMLLRRYPFGIVFRETGGRLEIIAVAHGRRRPGYWRERVR